MSLISSPSCIASLWQYQHLTGQPRKKTTHTALPLQSTVDRGIKPPKFMVAHDNIQFSTCVVVPIMAGDTWLVILIVNR